MTHCCLTFDFCRVLCFIVWPGEIRECLEVMFAQDRTRLCGGNVGYRLDGFCWGSIGIFIWRRNLLLRWCLLNIAWKLLTDQRLHLLNIALGRVNINLFHKCSQFWHPIYTYTNNIVPPTLLLHWQLWELATGRLKLTLTGHISAVRALTVSPRQPYLFSAGEDKQVKCWDLEYNKVLLLRYKH